MEAYQVRALLASFFDIDSDKKRIERGELTSRISLSQAYNTYTRKRVDAWIKAGLIKGQKLGENTSTVTLDRIELMLLDKTENRHIFLEQ